MFDNIITLYASPNLNFPNGLNWKYSDQLGVQGEVFNFRLALIYVLYCFSQGIALKVNPGFCISSVSMTSM